MIAQLSGVLAHKSTESLIIDVNGVGYQVAVSLNTFYKLPALGAAVRVLVHTYVREDILQLYGFLQAAERDGFLLLLNVSGIGPRLALNILSGISIHDLREALEAGDEGRLVAVPGVGKKTAQRMVVELRDKFALIGGEAPEMAPLPTGGIEADAVSALVNLGYRRAEVSRAVKAVWDECEENLEMIIRSALKKLSG